MSARRGLIAGALSGALFGALFIGLGGRMVMRILAVAIAREPAFSIGGSLEVIAYGAIVGLVSGGAFALARPILPERHWIAGLLQATITYAGTILTLPAHFAETARPFADRIPVVLLLFGLCFLLFGLATAYFNSLWSSPAQAAAPAAPPE
jgi:hypothetical protein